LQPPEKQGKDHHHEEQLDDRLEKAKGGLLVPDLHITGDKTVEQFPVFPELVEILPAPIFLGGG